MSLRLPSLFVVAILTGAAFGAESKPAAPAPKATTAPALRADSSRKLEDAAGNFRLKIAAADWKNALVPDSVPFARYAWTHARMPGLTAWFGVEELPPEAPWGLGEQVRYAETRLLMDPAELQVWGQQRAAGQMWARIGHLGKMDGLVSSFGVFQDQYMLWNNGFLYQLHLFGRAEDQDQITAAARQILGTFSIIEPERIAKPRAELAQAPAWESRGLGLRVPGMVGWLPLSNAASNAPHLHHCRIRTASSAGIGFAAARIDGADLSERQMIDAALATLMIGYDERQVSVSAYEPSPAPPGLKRAFQLKTERPVDGTPTSYRFLVLLTDRAFYALSAWADRGDRAGLEAAEHALSFAQFTPLEGSTPPPLLDADETRIRSSLFNQFGLGAAAEGRFEDALPWFEKGLLIDAKNWDILANFSYTLSRLGRSSEAADRISTAFKDGLEKKPDRVLFLARTLADADRRSEARALYEQALRSNQLSEEGLLSYIGLLGNADDWNTALDALRAAQKNRPSLRLQRWEGSVLSRLERYPEALAHLEKLHQAHPDDVEITEDLASVHLDAGQWREALDLVEPVLKQPVHTNNVSFLALKARAQHGLGWTRQASSTVDAALKDNPENPTLQQLRQLIGSAVGQGNPEWLRTPFEAVPLSDANRDWILADAPAQPAQDSESSWFDYRITSVHFEPGKPRRRTIRYRARIFDQAGVREFSTLQFTFHPPWERFHAHRIQVKDATTGVVIATGSIDDAFVSNPSQGAVVTEERLISIPVPGLRPGTLLEAEVTIGTADPVRDFDFINEILTGSTPSAARGLVVTGKIDRLRHLCADTVTAARRGDALCWRVTAPARMLPEPLSPAPEKFAPTVWISDSDEGADWKTVAQGFLKDIQNRLKPDPEAATWVASLKLPTDLPPAERIQRIVERLRRDINYQGLEFGPHSRMPHPPSKVLKDRYGDCKDQSLLLLQALAASDIPAHLTLVGSTNPIRDALPSLDQFDHMVVHVPGSGAEPFIDPTQRDGMLRLPVPSGLDDRHLLILDPENPRLHRTKAYPADMGELRIERQVRPLEDGRLHVSETLFTSDYWAETLRGSLRDTDPVYRREWIENVASDAAQGAVEVGKIDITPLQNPDQPLKLVSEWDSPVAIDSDAAQMRVLWPSWEAYFLPPNGSTLRYNPLELRYALRMDSRTTLHAPSGSVWDVGPGEKVFNGKFGTGKLSWAPGKNTTELVLDLHFERPTGYHPKDAYTAFRREMEAVIQTLRRQPWKLRPAPASAAPGL